MKSFYYIVRPEPGGPTLTCLNLNDVFKFLKKEGFVSTFRYNDTKTGNSYSEAAAEHCLSGQEQLRRPIFIVPATSDEGVFVESEAFWVANYMLDEFYNPEKAPYIEAVPIEGPRPNH